MPSSSSREMSPPSPTLSFEQVLTPSTMSWPGPPPLESFDRQIEGAHGHTFALSLQPHHVQAQKMRSRPNCEQRLVELVKENSSYRRELCFFRTVYQAMDRARDGVAAIAQQLTLNYYIRPDLVGQGDAEWLRLADELGRVLQRYGEVVNAAAQEWVDLENHQTTRDRADMI